MYQQTIQAAPSSLTLRYPVVPTPARDDRAPIPFRDFVAFPAARRLLRGGAAVDIGGRAFDLLLVLLRARGRVVARDRIMDEVWPGTFVDESNLRFQISTLRKMLGKDRELIKTVAGRGYMLIEEADAAEAPQDWTFPLRYRLQLASRS